MSSPFFACWMEGNVKKKLTLICDRLIVTLRSPVELDCSYLRRSTLLFAHQATEWEGDLNIVKSYLKSKNVRIWFFGYTLPCIINKIITVCDNALLKDLDGKTAKMARNARMVCLGRVSRIKFTIYTCCTA